MVDQELIDGFVAEMFDLLDEIEPQLIELIGSGDTSSVDTDMLNAVFRLFHSMKGSAGFLGLSTVSRVTHEAETLLDRFRKGVATLSVGHVEVLCLAIDFLRVLLETISQTGADAGHESESESIVVRLTDLIHQIDRGDSTDLVEIETVPTADPPASPEAEVLDLGASDDALPEVIITDSMRQSYMQEAEEFLDQAEESLLALENLKGEEASEKLTDAFRALHSLKGNSGFMGFVDIEKLSHCIESALDGMRQGTVDADSQNVGSLLTMVDVLREAANDVAAGGNGAIPKRKLFVEILEDTVIGKTVEKFVTPAPAKVPVADVVAEVSPTPPSEVTTTAAASTAPAAQPSGGGKTVADLAKPSAGAPKAVRSRQDIRVDIEKLDSLINLVGELVIAEAMVTRHPHVADAEIENLDKSVHLLRRVSRDLQDVAMSARMIPLAGTFRKMIRLVHDLSTKSGKSIELKLVGEDTEVDKTVIEQIADPLVHIVRNSADHGVESKDERSASGKPAEATITIEGRHEGSEVWILISDDGRGLNREKILSKAIKNGLVTESVDDWDDDRVFRLIFEPGFSTADQVTDISGRGVGMDVVKRNIEKLKGKVDVRSAEGKGTTIILRIPLTLAIIDGMLVRVGSARYTIPMLAIRESVRPEANWITVTPDGQETVRIRDDFFPVLRLHQRFRKTPDSDQIADGILILVESDRQVIALLVDEIVGQQETVIKGLSEFLGDSEGVSGCTILGDGEVSLILDTAGLVEGHELS